MSAIKRDAAQLTHLDETGRARMVDVSAKAVTAREATAAGEVRLARATFELLRDQARGRAQQGFHKGDVLAVAHVAGVMAAKQTGQLIPLCHPINLDGLDLGFDFDEGQAAVTIRATARTSGRTGVEMEAMTAVAVAALTIYDMVKGVDRSVVIGNVRLLEKKGGKSGHWAREEP